MLIPPEIEALILDGRALLLNTAQEGARGDSCVGLMDEAGDPILSINWGNLDYEPGQYCVIIGIDGRNVHYFASAAEAVKLYEECRLRC